MESLKLWIALEPNQLEELNKGNEVFSRMRSKGSRFTLGVWGLRVCSLDVAFVVATVRNRPQPFATVRAIPVWPCPWEVLQRRSFLEVSDVSLLRFAWQAWHFVTFRRVLQRVESRFAWQAQYFCDVFTRCVAVFVAGAALWTCPSSFSWQARHFRRVVLRVFANRIGRPASSGDKVQIPWQAWHLCDVMKIDGCLARNIDFEVANFQVLRKTRRKTSILKLQSVKIGGSLARNARFGAPTCLVSRL